jgi:RNA recognition motif-containing protein
MSQALTIKDAIMFLLKECIPQQNESHFPKKRVSYLFANQADISNWLSSVPPDVRQQAYESWKTSKVKDPSRIRNSIRISNLSPHITEADLLIICNPIGKVRDIYRPINRETGQPITSAFIDFENPIDILVAIKELTGCTFFGQTLCVDIPSTAFTSNPSAHKKTNLGL